MSRPNHEPNLLIEIAKTLTRHSVAIGQVGCGGRSRDISWNQAQDEFLVIHKASSSGCSFCAVYCMRSLKAHAVSNKQCIHKMFMFDARRPLSFKFVNSILNTIAFFLDQVRNDEESSPVVSVMTVNRNCSPIAI
jgi:aldehyde:ferredoxin oxidoreductase